LAVSIQVIGGKSKILDTNWLSLQGVWTPFLHLDNLVVGDYTFRLKVTDAAGQENTADVHVFVKPGL